MGSDRGLYSCQVDYQGSVQQVQHRLVVLESPSVVTQPANTSLAVWLGETLVLRCAASGHPNPLISWRAGRGQEELGQGLSLRLTVSRETEGEYQCLADNGVGQPAGKTFSLTVLCKLSVRSHFLFVCFPRQSITVISLTQTSPVSISPWQPPSLTQCSRPL